VTGFGLLGHLLEMMTGSKTRAKLFAGRVPVLDGIVELAEQGVVPGGTKSNMEFVQHSVQFAQELPEAKRWVLADAQTNGGLLAAIPAAQSRKAISALARARVEAAIIGEVFAGPAGIDVVG